jgi:hypothetical protein
MPPAVAPILLEPKKTSRPITLKLDFGQAEAQQRAASRKGGAADPEKPGRRRPARREQWDGEV